MAELKGSYKEDFNKVKKYIEKTAAKSSEREDALEGLFQIYLEAQENEEGIFAVHRNSSEEYAKEICESLPEKKKADKKFIFLILAAAIIVALIFGICLFEKPEEAEKISTYDIYGEKDAYLFEDQLMLDVTFENTGNTTLHLSFDTEIWDYNNGTWSLWLNKGNYSGGTQEVLPHETTNFFNSFDFAELISGSGMTFDNNLFKIRREVFRYNGSGEKESLGFAEWIFNIETYSGTVAFGDFGTKFTPDQSLMPKEIVFANEEQKEYCEELIDGINYEKLIRFYAESFPNDNICTAGISRGNAIKIIEKLKKIELLTCEPKNPNTGGGYSFYIETMDENIAISSNGGFFIIYIEGEPYGYAFDAESCNNEFGAMWKIAEEILAEYIVPVEEGEANPQPRNAPDIGETHWIIPKGVDIRGTLFNNREKVSVNSLFFEDLRLILKEENFDKDRIEHSDMFLGDPFYPVDMVEFVRNDTGKKYVINIFENGFSLSGSAFSDEEKNAIYFAYDETWEKFKEKIKKDYYEADDIIPYWVGLVHEKNVSEIIVSYENDSCSFVPDEFNFGEFIRRFRRFDVLSPGERFVGKSLSRPEEKHVAIVIKFNTGTEYMIIVTEDEMSMVSSDMNYGLIYKLPEDSYGWDEFYDFAYGGPINAVTG